MQELGYFVKEEKRETEPTFSKAYSSQDTNVKIGYLMLSLFSERR